MKSPQWFTQLPIAPPPGDRWQISLRDLSITVTEEKDEPWHPRLLLIVESGTGAVLGHRLLEPDADPDLVLDLLMGTMDSPAMGKPRRPQVIQTDTDQLLPFLKELSDQLDIKVEQAPDLPELSYAINSFEEFMNLKPGLYLESEEAEPEAIADFFQAAADYYRKEPWVRISDIEPLTLFADEWEEPRYAVIMGNGGIMHGLALYEDAEDLQDLYVYEDFDPTELECTAVTFGDKEELSEEQSEEIESNGWEIASQEAVPLATRTDALGPPRMPTAEQLRELEIALRVVPSLVEQLPEDEDDRQPTEPQPWTLELNGREVQGMWGYGLFQVEQIDEDAEQEETV